MQLSDAEWKVMDAIWKRHPSTVRDVLLAVEEETGWAYSTVRTFLGRLVDKGALAVEKRGNSSVFEPLISRHQARRSALRSLVERAFGGTFGPLVHQLLDDEKLSEDERRELAAMLEEGDMKHSAADGTRAEAADSSQGPSKEGDTADGAPEPAS